MILFHRMWQWVIAAPLILSPPTVQAESPLIGPDYFRETLRADVPVSGSVLSGFVVAQDNFTSIRTELFTYTPAGTNTLCVTVRSIDGRYLANSSYSVINEKAGWVALKFPSNHQTALRAFNNDTLTILAMVLGDKQRCNQEGVVMLASWHDPSRFVDHTAKIHINSGRVKSSIRPVASKGKPIICKKVKSDRLVAYDKVCSVNFPQLTNGDWAVLRQRMGNFMRPVHFSVFAENSDE